MSIESNTVMYFARCAFLNTLITHADEHTSKEYIREKVQGAMNARSLRDLRGRLDVSRQRTFDNFLTVALEKFAGERIVVTGGDVWTFADAMEAAEEIRNGDGGEQELETRIRDGEFPRPEQFDGASVRLQLFGVMHRTVK